MSRLSDRHSRAFKRFAVLLPGRTRAALLVVAVLGVLAALAASADQSFVDDSRAEAVSYDGGWETLTAAVPMPYPRDGLAATTDGTGRIYAIGGNNGDPRATVERYDPHTGSWTTLPGLTTARTGLAAATDATDDRGRIYAIGGRNGTTTLGTVERYDPATDTWTTLTGLISPRWSLAGATDGQGRLYAIGGISAAGSRVSTVERLGQLP